MHYFKIFKPKINFYDLIMFFFFHVINKYSKNKTKNFVNNDSEHDYDMV